MKKLFIVSALMLLAFTAANLIVKHFGATGLLFSSALLIPFDFVCRCVLHERLKGHVLVNTLLGITMLAGAITFAVNHDANRIAAASVVGFLFAQVGAGVFYQYAKSMSAGYLVKVNVSDLCAIVFDSIAFQWVAFGHFDLSITLWQIAIKFAGGLMWYWILFVKLRIHESKQVYLTDKELDAESLEHFPDDTQLHASMRRIWKERYRNNTKTTI